MKKISVKQQKILDFIGEFTALQGYPPSVREIGSAVNLRSPSTVHAHLKTLRDMGYLEKDDRKTRAISIKGTAGAVEKIPILGKVTAGLPILAVEDIEGYIPFSLSGQFGEHFALRIRGESMIGAGILDDDLIVVRKQAVAQNGQIVVAMLEDEATCKRLRFKNGQVWLMPENPDFEPINGMGCSILGVVVAVYRHYNV